MSIQDPTHPVSRADRGRLQFSLRAMLALTALVAVASAVLFTMPDYLAVPIIIVSTIALPALLTAALVYGNSWQRSFCVGAMFPAGMMFFCTLVVVMYCLDVDFENPGEFCESVTLQYSSYRLYAGVSWVLSITIGLFTVALRRALQR